MSADAFLANDRIEKAKEAQALYEITDTAASGSMAPVSLALLLRLGRSDLAEQLWKATETAVFGVRNSARNGDPIASFL